jgi:hypothetical protein
VGIGESRASHSLLAREQESQEGICESPSWSEAARMPAPGRFARGAMIDDEPVADSRAVALELIIVASIVVTAVILSWASGLRCWGRLALLSPFGGKATTTSARDWV